MELNGKVIVQVWKHLIVLHDKKAVYIRIWIFAVGFAAKIFDFALKFNVLSQLRDCVIVLNVVNLSYCIEESLEMHVHRDLVAPLNMCLGSEMIRHNTLTSLKRIKRIVWAETNCLFLRSVNK